MRTTISFIGLFLFFGLTGQSQNQDILQDLRFITDHNRQMDNFPSTRKADQVYEELVRQLDDQGFSIDSLKDLASIQRLEGLDLITYQVPLGVGAYKHYGLIIRENHEPRISRLTDVSDDVPISETLVLRDSDWMGVYVYATREVPAEEGRLIMTFGYDSHDDTQRKKIIDFIYLKEDGTIETGYPALFHPEGPYYRRVFSYNADNTIRVNYDKDLDLIIFDNLISFRDALGRPGGVGDGSYAGYKWDGEKWVYKEKIFDHVYEEAPRPNAILDRREDGLGKRPLKSKRQ